MAVDFDQLADYTFAQIKQAAKAAMIGAALGGNQFSINGRMLGRITPGEATKLYQWASQMEATEADTSNTGGIALVERGDRR